MSFFSALPLGLSTLFTAFLQSFPQSFIIPLLRRAEQIADGLVVSARLQRATVSFYPKEVCHHSLLPLHCVIPNLARTRPRW
jgi:hypothetical protein